MATLLLLLTTFVFNFFVAHFASYNRLYGSIGTLIVILIWINFNSLQLLIGFELNASIENAQSKSPKGKKEKKAEGYPNIQRSV